MAVDAVSGVWVRNVPANNFLNIERHPSHGPVGGGGALYLEAPGSVVPALLELLGRDPAAGIEARFDIDTAVMGAPHISALLTWDSKSGHRMRLFQNRQSDPDRRHPAWRAERGFPKAPDSVATTSDAATYIADGLRVYVVRTAGGEYFAGFLVGGYPSDWPDDDTLRALFTGAGGVKRFAGGLYLESEDQRRPFRTDAAPAVAAPGGVIDSFDDPDVVEADGVAQPAPAYATPQVAVAVDRIAMDRAVEWANATFPDATVKRMPHNNPGTTSSSRPAAARSGMSK